MIEEEYNPEIHCCPYWYKDICDCVSRRLKAARKRKNTRNVNSTTKFLNENNINYKPSNTYNVVIVNPDTDNIYLSLKQDNGLLKCRYSGRDKWYTFSKQKFMEKFAKYD